MMKNDYIFPFLWMRDQSEETLRTEIAKIQECGIHSVCVESRPHPDFGGEGWWHDFDIILDEAKKREMHIWILDDAHFPTGQANGQIPAQHPELARRYVMMQHTDCVGPVPAASLDVNLLMTKRFTWMDFGKKIEQPLVDARELLSVTAYPIVEGDTLCEEGVDLTDRVTDGILHWDIPGGVWRICVTFTTYDFGARNDYINYIDAASVRVLIDAIYELHYQRYAEEFGETIVGFFSDEPGFYNVEGFDMNDAIGRKKMALPWCEEIGPLLAEAMGDDWKAKLPFLWMDTQKKEAAAAARLAYMDQVSRLYAKNFTGQIGAWCEEHQVSYIGHVIEDNGEHTRLGSGAGHYFRAVSGQHMAGIDTIGGQILPGNPYASRHGIAYVGDGVFYHYGLPKLGASAAQIDPKKKGRLMCEAFGAYGWNFGVKSMKWLTDFLLVNGVNHLVPHAFSMADYPDIDCPPHFYARGNNGQFRWFAELMQYANRMCGLLNGGKNVPVAAVIYPAENDWMQDCMPVQLPARELTEHQIDFEILPEDVFSDRSYFGTRIADGKLTVNGRDMRIVIIPGTTRIDAKLSAVIPELLSAGIPILFVEQIPEGVPGCECVPLGELGKIVRRKGYEDIRSSEEAKSLIYYHYEKDASLYFLFNTSLSETVKTEITFRETASALQYDGLKDAYYQVPQRQDGSGIVIPLELAPYESAVLMFGVDPEEVLPAKASDVWTKEQDISSDWQVSRVRAIDYPDFQGGENMKELVPVSDVDSEFAGLIRYEKDVELSAVGEAAFEAEHVFETAELFVNGASAGKRLTPPYRWDLGGLCTEGMNTFVVEVANTPTRDTLRNPGPFGPEREILEPAGMFGRIVIKSKEEI